MINLSLNLDLLGPPLLAGILVCLTHIPLGRRVLQRGIIFMDLAVAQIAALGVLAVILNNPNAATIWIQLAALVSALLGAGWLHLCESRWPEIQEALIGVTFVLAATASLLWIAHSPHGEEALQSLLVGQILWVSYSQLIPVAILYSLVFFLLKMESRWGLWVFYVSFALAVTASVQLIGVYLVFASLIIPALAIRQLSPKKAILVGCGIGIVSYALGLILSSWFDWATGPLIVWVLAVVAVVSQSKMVLSFVVGSSIVGKSIVKLGNFFSKVIN